MKLIYTEEFKGDLSKIRDRKIQTRIKKIIQKIIDNPEIGKTMRYELFPLRSIRIISLSTGRKFTGDAGISHSLLSRATPKCAIEAEIIFVKI